MQAIGEWKRFWAATEAERVRKQNELQEKQRTVSQANMVSIRHWKERTQQKQNASQPQAPPGGNQPERFPGSLRLTNPLLPVRAAKNVANAGNSVVQTITGAKNKVANAGNSVVQTLSDVKDTVGNAASWAYSSLSLPWKSGSKPENEADTPSTKLFNLMRELHQIDVNGNTFNKFSPRYTKLQNAPRSDTWQETFNTLLSDVDSAVQKLKADGATNQVGAAHTPDGNNTQTPWNVTQDPHTLADPNTGVELVYLEDAAGTPPTGDNNTPGTGTPATDTPVTGTQGTNTPQDAGQPNLNAQTAGTNAPGTGTPGTGTPDTDTPVDLAAEARKAQKEAEEAEARIQAEAAAAAQKAQAEAQRGAAASVGAAQPEPEEKWVVFPASRIGMNSTRYFPYVAEEDASHKDYKKVFFPSKKDETGAETELFKEAKEKNLWDWQIVKIAQCDDINGGNRRNEVEVDMDNMQDVRRELGVKDQFIAVLVRNS